MTNKDREDALKRMALIAVTRQAVDEMYDEFKSVAKEIDVDVDLLIQVMIDELKRRKKKTSTMIELDLGDFLDE